MKLKRNKLVSLFLVFFLLTLSGNLYAKERRGAKLQIIKKNGILQAGELITVKPNSLLLLSLTGWDVSVEIRDIKTIRIVKRSKVLPGIGLGLLIGAGTGALMGFSQGDRSDQFLGLTATENALFGGIFLGAIGLLAGGALGFASGLDNTIQIEGMTDSEIQEAMDKLRKKARIRDYK